MSGCSSPEMVDGRDESLCVRPTGTRYCTVNSPVNPWPATTPGCARPTGGAPHPSAEGGLPRRTPLHRYAYMSRRTALVIALKAQAVAQLPRSGPAH